MFVCIHRQNEGRLIDGEKEVQHRKYVELKRKLEDVEKRVCLVPVMKHTKCLLVQMSNGSS